MKKRILCLVLAMGILLSLLAGCGAKREIDEEKINTLLQDAQAMLEAENYADSLEKYLAVMELDMKNMEARFGTVRCQIGLGNISLAETNLSMAQQIDPSRIEVCELYMELSHITGNVHYSQNAVALAREYGHESIIDKIPAEPVFEQEPGTYSENIWLDIRCDDPGAEVYYSLYNSSNPNVYVYNTLCPDSVRLVRGENTVTAYSIKEGVASETVAATFLIDYPEQEITFQDPKIEELVRYKLGNRPGPLTNYDCETVDMLSWSDFYSIYSSYNTIYNIQFQTLEDLQYLPGLRYLYLNEQRSITDYSPLLNCPALYQINLDNCGLTTADVVNYVPGLMYLGMCGNNISDFSAIENVKELYMLQVYYNNGSGTIDEVLKTNKTIEQLGIDSDQLTDYSLLSELENLLYLDIYGISGLSEEDYAELSKLTGLLGLTIYQNYQMEGYNVSIPDLSFLQNMKDLQQLNLYGVNDAAQLEYIKQLPNLQYLYLYESAATRDAGAMSALTLALPNCRISSY